MATSSPLLVLTSLSGTPHKAQRRFRRAVEGSGGMWLEIDTSVAGVAEQVRNFARGAFVLIHDETDLPVAGCEEELDSALGLSPLADVLYADKFLPRRRRGAATRARYPAWSPVRMESDQYIGNSFLVRASSLLSIAPALKSDAPWRAWDFLRECVASQARVEHIDAVWFERTPAVGTESKFPWSSATLLPKSRSGLDRSAECAVITVTTEGNHNSTARNDHAPLANFSRSANVARTSAHGEILVFVDDDFVPLRDDWLAQLTQPFDDPTVAVCGATTLRHDGSLCHVGISDVMDARAQEFAGLSPEDSRVAKLLHMNREVDAVSGGCMAIRADVFDSVGGFFNGFPSFYADIDLCLKARTVGYRVVNVGEVLGRHGEHRWRDGPLLPDEQALFISRWPTHIGNSEYAIESYG